MNKKLINKIARKIVLSKLKGSCRQNMDENFNIDSLIVNDVQIINDSNNNNNANYIYVYIDVEAIAEAYEQPYDYWGPPPGFYVRDHTIQIKNYYDPVIKIYYQDKEMKFNSNDKIKISFEGVEFEGKFDKIKNDIVQYYVQQFTFQDDWEFYDDRYYY